MPGATRSRPGHGGEALVVESMCGWAACRPPVRSDAFVADGGGQGGRERSAGNLAATEAGVTGCGRPWKARASCVSAGGRTRRRSSWGGRRGSAACWTTRRRAGPQPYRRVGVAQCGYTARPRRCCMWRPGGCRIAAAACRRAKRGSTPGMEDCEGSDPTRQVQRRRTCRDRKPYPVRRGCRCAGSSQWPTPAPRGSGAIEARTRRRSRIGTSRRRTLALHFDRRRATLALVEVLREWRRADWLCEPR